MRAVGGVQGEGKWRRQEYFPPATRHRRSAMAAALFPLHLALHGTASSCSTWGASLRQPDIASAAQTFDNVSQLKDLHLRPIPIEIKTPPYLDREGRPRKILPGVALLLRAADYLPLQVVEYREMKLRNCWMRLPSPMGIVFP